jgi:hypothetical protein
VGDGELYCMHLLIVIGHEMLVLGKSTLGFCCSVGSGMISWFSRKQGIVALSLAEA